MAIDGPDYTSPDGTIACWGGCSEYATINVKGEYLNGFDLDEICADGGWTGWAHACKVLQEWADNNRCIIFELESDEPTTE